MTLDVPNAFVQTDIPQGGKRIIMKIRGALVDILMEIDPAYQSYVRTDRQGKIIYVLMRKALYGMMVLASVLYYKKFRNDIEAVGFKINVLLIVW